jgi:hypothetical protein
MIQILISLAMRGSRLDTIYRTTQSSPRSSSPVNGMTQQQLFAGGTQKNAALHGKGFLETVMLLEG